MSKEKTWYLQCKKRLPEIGILVGDPARVDIFAANMEQVTKVSSHHGFKMIIGQFKKTPMSVLSFGMGAPAAAVAIEELAILGTKIVVRAGTAMALNCSLGDLIVAEGAVRLDGTSPWYLPLAFPAIPDAQLLTAFIKYLEQEKINYVSGIMISIDALHPKRIAQLEKENMNLTQHIRGIDMETATIFAASRALGLRSLSVCLASVKFGNFEKLSKKERKNGEQHLVSVVLQGVCQYVK
ncbi:MAG: hypothetical protein QXJ07_04510 [Candidatus Bathyarchaeia archaeon]|uniref:phosphorylase family protein n=1 Tax=Candidatus Hadarchaeum sp. TaxID=2883567 RepID=UPI00316B158F